MKRHWDIKWGTLTGKALPSRHFYILFVGLETPWPAFAFSLLRAGKVWASTGCVRICWKVPSTAVPRSRCWLCSAPWEHNQSISLASGWPQLGLFPLTLRPGSEHGASDSIAVRAVAGAGACAHQHPTNFGADTKRCGLHAGCSGSGLGAQIYRPGP